MRSKGDAQMSKVKLAGAVFFVALAAASSRAQLPPAATPGFKADGVYDFKNVDNVSLMNGGLSINIPIVGPYAVNGGLNWSLQLNYTNQAWEAYPTTCPPTGALISVRSRSFDTERYFCSSERTSLLTSANCVSTSLRYSCWRDRARWRSSPMARWARIVFP